MLCAFGRNHRDVDFRQLKDAEMQSSMGVLKCPGASKGLYASGVHQLVAQV